MYRDVKSQVHNDFTTQIKGHCCPPLALVSIIGFGLAILGLTLPNMFCFVVVKHLHFGTLFNHWFGIHLLYFCFRVRNDEFWFFFQAQLLSTNSCILRVFNDWFRLCQQSSRKFRINGPYNGPKFQLKQRTAALQSQSRYTRPTDVQTKHFGVGLVKTPTLILFN